MSALGTLLLSLGSLAALCLGMPKHYRQVFHHGCSRPRSRGLRALGWGLMVLSFTAAVYGRGWQVGIIEWIGVLCVSGLALTLSLPFLGRGIAQPSLPHRPRAR